MSRVTDKAKMRAMHMLRLMQQGRAEEEDMKNLVEGIRLADKRIEELEQKLAEAQAKPTRDQIIQCLLATQGQSEGVTADAILSLWGQSYD